MCLDTTIQCLKDTGFEVETDNLTLPWSVKKDHYFNRIRSRMFSVLDHFTDDEIEEGLREISKKLPADKENIENNDAFLIISAKAKLVYTK